MTQQEYEQKREQEWRAFCNRHGIIDRGHVILFSAFFDAFDRAYALGKQEGTSKNSSESNPAEPTENKADEIADKAINPIEEYFDNILKDGFHDHNRLHIAAQIVASMIGSDDWTTWRGGSNKEIWHNMAKSSLEIADALIAEAAKGESK